MSDLPVNIASSYPDRSAGDTAHQGHHDAIHGLYNALAGATPDPSTLGIATETYVDTAVANATSDSLWLPAPMFQKVAGSPLLESSRSGGNGWPAYFLDAVSGEALQIATVLPPDWTQYDIDLYWSNGGAGAGNVRWQAAWGSAGNGESVSTLAAAGSVQTFAAPAQFTLKVSALETGITASAGEITTIRIARDAANDTLANDAVIFGVMLRKA